MLLAPHISTNGPALVNGFKIKIAVSGFTLHAHLTNS